MYHLDSLALARFIHFCPLLILAVRERQKDMALTELLAKTDGAIHHSYVFLIPFLLPFLIQAISFDRVFTTQRNFPIRGDHEENYPERKLAFNGMG